MISASKDVSLVGMSRALRELTERQIAKALAEGQLRDLEGEGRTLPDRSGEAFTDMATQVAFRIMAEAGALPEEFTLKKALLAARAAYGGAETETEKRLAMALIADLEQRYHIAQEARRAFMR
ncbi:MAG: DnaJ family domain-containing protein [Pseudomonadota bacterium]